MADDEDRPRKSWREIDAQRGRSSHHGSSDQSKRAEQRRQSSQAYRSYKSQLNKLFEGGAVPDALKSKLDGDGISQKKAMQKKALQDVLDAKSAKERAKALNRYREAYAFPQDEEVLAKLLELEDEPEIVVEALQTIGRLKDEGLLKRASSLKARIKTAQMTIDDDDVHAEAKALLQKL